MILPNLWIIYFSGSLVQQARFQNSAKLNDNIMLRYPKKNQLCTRIVNHNNSNNKVVNDLIYHAKRVPMLCAHSPSVHSHHFYIWHVSFDHWAFLYKYLLDVHCTIEWQSIKIFYGNINIPVSKCFLNNKSLFFKKIDNSISHVSTTTTVLSKKI